MKFNLNKIMRWFFLFMMLDTLFLYFMGRTVDVKIIQFAAFTSLWLHLYGLYSNDSVIVEKILDTGDI